MLGPELATAAAVVAMGGAVLLRLIPSPCSCEKCGFHVNERRAEAERARAARHRNVHSYLDIPWGDERCHGCKAGNEGDRDG